MYVPTPDGCATNSITPDGCVKVPGCWGLGNAPIAMDPANVLAREETAARERLVVAGILGGGLLLLVGGLIYGGGSKRSTRIWR